MACRIRNTGKHALRVDLRNGETVHLRPGETSPALREELLYGNTYLAEWEARGILTRLPASMGDVIEHERKAAAGAAGAEKKEPPKRAAPSPPGERATPTSGPAESGRAKERPANERARDDR